MDYKGVSIQLKEFMPGETLPYDFGGGTVKFGSPAFVAESRFGIAVTTLGGEQAITDAKRLIDTGLRQTN